MIFPAINLHLQEFSMAMLNNQMVDINTWDIYIEPWGIQPLEHS